MTEGNTHPITEGMCVVQDPSHPGTYLFHSPARLTEDPEYPKLYQIGS